ncbi:hypothetical protein AgCh_023449 [Apium graveolens]
MLFLVNFDPQTCKSIYPDVAPTQPTTSQPPSTQSSQPQPSTLTIRTSSSRPKRTIFVPRSPPRRKKRIIIRDEFDEDEEAQVPASEPVTIAAEESILQKESEAEGSGIQKRKRSANSDIDHVSPPSSRKRKIRAGVKIAQAQYEEAEEGDQESLISTEPVIIEAFPAPKDTVPDTVITPPLSPVKETATVEDSRLSPEIDIHRLHISFVLFLEAPQGQVTTPPVSPLNAEIPTTPILDVETDEVVPESPTATHTLVLSEDAEISLKELNEALLKKFVEEDAHVPWEETHRRVEWTKKWNESVFIPSSKVQSDHIAKVDELLTNSDFKAQLKVTALNTKSLLGQHSITHAKVDKLQKNADKLDLMLKLDMNRFIRPIHENVEAIEKVQEKQQAQLAEKKDDSEDDQGNPSKGRGQDKAESQDSQKFLQTLKLKGRETTVYYKDPKIQTLDEEIARRLFLMHNPRMDLENLKEEKAIFAAEKTNLKSKASNTKKPPRPKEKGIVMKEKSNSDSKTRSQVEIDPKVKGKEKVDESTKIQKNYIAQSTQTLEAQSLSNSEKLSAQGINETANHDQVIKTSTSDRAQVDLNNMTVADKKKLLWKNVKPSDPKKSQLLSNFMTIGLKAREARDRAGLGSEEAKIKTGVEVITRDPFLLTDTPLEEVTKKYLDKVISVQVVLDAHDKSNVKENLILFLEDGRTYRVSESDVLNKSLKELQFFHYLLEIKSEITRRWSNFIIKTIRDKAVVEFIPNIVEDDGSEIPIKKDSAKLEVILKEKCMCYNEDSSHPRIIRLGDGLEKNHISALRTLIYQIGSQDEQMKQVKATLAQVLRITEEKLISNFVKNHFGFRLTQ